VCADKTVSYQKIKWYHELLDTRSFKIGASELALVFKEGASELAPTP
jgi:hypothetical protein